MSRAFFMPSTSGQFVPKLDLRIGGIFGIISLLLEQNPCKGATTMLALTLGKIDQLKAQLDSVAPFNDGEQKRLREQFMVEYTYNSNAIEGSTLTLHETALVLLEDLTIAEKPLRDHLDAVGHRDAFAYVLEISKQSNPLTERIIKDIHSLVLATDSQNKGKYRNVAVTIAGALDTPPLPAEVPQQVEKLLADYAKDKRHPIEKIADFHIQFERIHPFIDGNGRTGRLLLNLELIKAGYAPIDVKFTDRRQYIDCFRDYAQTNSSRKFVEMVAQYELQELTKLADIAAQRPTQNTEMPAHDDVDR